MLTAASALSPTSASAPDRAAIRRAAEGFEAMFLATLLKGARAGLPGDPLTGGAALRQMTGMLDMELAQSAAARAGLGLAEAVARQFARAEGGA